MSHELVLYELENKGGVRNSPYCWYIRAALALLKVPYRTEGLGFLAVARKYEELGLKPSDNNPHPTVPFLVDGAKTIVDSWDIALHLHEHYGKDAERSLFPHPGIKEACQFIYRQIDKDIVITVFLAVVGNLQNIASDPEYFANKVKKMTGADVESLNEKKAEHEAKLKNILNFYSSYLADKEFMLGSQITYADCLLLGGLKLLTLVHDEGDAALHTPDGHLERWWAHVHRVLEL